MKSFFKVLGILICLALMVGFGVCGLMGVVAGVAGGIGALGILLGLIGLAISAGCFLLIRSMLNSGAKDRPPSK